MSPIVDQEIQADIYQALLKNKQVTAMYQPTSGEQPKENLLHPLRLIMRGSVSYLVAKTRNYSQVRLYTLHRFSKIEVLNATVKSPKGFDLDKANANGLADFANQGEPIQLEMRCDEWVTSYLTETLLSANQTVSIDAVGWARITATVNDTWQLRW